MHLLAYILTGLLLLALAALGWALYSRRQLQAALALERETSRKLAYYRYKEKTRQLHGKELDTYIDDQLAIARKSVEHLVGKGPAGTAPGHTNDRGKSPGSSS